MTENKPIAFKAEIKQLLNILIHSLYTDREIFLRELISNASDALTQMDFLMLTDHNVLEPDAELAIRLSVDEDEKIITISDSGIGMTRDELSTNLGTIAQSGARAFLDAAEEGVDQQQLTDVIGQFGVGFYSVFMVAEWVRVTSRSYKPRAKAASWYATGGDTFTVEAAEKKDRGTTIQIKLNEDTEEFANEGRLRDIIKTHSDYVRFPIFVGDAEEQTNRQTAIWRQSSREVQDDEYTEFYKHLTLDFEDPITRVHFVADAPLRIFSLLYIPSKPERNMFSLRKEDGLKLYARKILIQEYTTDLLPQHFRFIQGVVDSEDLPLNVSRETIQATALMARIKKILTGQVTKQLQAMADKEPEKYAQFWASFGPFIKEGIASQETDRESLFPFVRFHTTIQPESWVSLSEYVQRMKDDQDKIYYILGDDDRSVARSPHLDYFRKHGYEVITLTDPMDSFMLMGLREYADYELQNVAAPDLELPAAEQTPEDEPVPEALPKKDFEKIVERFKWHLGERVTDVRATERLSDSVARLVDPEGSMGQEMQRVYRLVDREYEVPKKVLELNPSHPIVLKLHEIPGEDERNATIIEQIYESALLIEGLHPDPASMLPRIQTLMEAALK
ncbi:MAG: molecular chaperone HtpG [Anaerolineales bacterium]|nr:molecular chaperone HtpG [Chloroflexota bacterium]MBL6980761.1 molecular chaperone HtpG [Anaerolineales bacterium]